MPQVLRNKRWFCGLSQACRILFAITFVVSGFFKAIDPWGTILSLNNYLAAYNLSAPEWLVVVLAILLCGAELMMGCMLLFKLCIRLVSIFSVLSMLFFTVLTLLSATIVPVEDCGCFGELIKLTPWQTFAKNLVLLPMAICFWYRYRTDRIFAFSKYETLLTCLLFTISMGVGTYCYRHLPLIDMLPYKVGVNIAEEMNRAREQHSSEKVVLLYRNRQSGEVREFSVDDKEWQDDACWEWVDTRVESIEAGLEPLILEFYISNAEGDKTHELLTTSGRLYMLCMRDSESVDADVRARFEAVERYAEANGGKVIYLTPEHLSDTAPHYLYNMDAKTMKTMLRADYGLVELEDGVIVAKYNYRDIPY